MATDDIVIERLHEASEPSDTPAPRADAIVRRISSPSMQAMTAPPEGNVSKYSELEGATGAAVLFRPDRYKASDLGEVLVELTVTDAGGVRHGCQLYDLSQTGLAFQADEAFGASPDELLQPVVLKLDGYAAYEGRMQVRSVRATDGTRIVGAVFLDDLLNVDEVLKLRDVKTAHQTSAKAISNHMSSWTVPGHHEFKSHVAELSLFLRSAKDELTRLEAQVPWEDVHGEEDTPSKHQLVAMLDKGFCTTYVDWLCRIDRRYREIDPACSDGLKAFSRALVHSSVLEAPIVARMFHKPLGYAGDYVVMNYLYTRRFEGPTLFAKAVHRASTMLSGGEAVRARKDYIRGQVRRIVEQWPHKDRAIRIASIAAGPAQETLELIADHSPDDPPVEFVLFDQDKRALSYAHSNVMSLLRRRQLPNVRVTCIQDAIKSLLRGKTALGERGPFDVVFSAGLMDYLKQELGRRLVSWFFEHLTPGGTCYVGNFATHNPSRWCMEHLFEWYLEYRVPNQMADLAAGLGPSAHVDVATERTGVNLFLVLRKGA